VKGSSQSGNSGLPKRHVWLCLLLAALFLYNPFVTAPSSGFGLNVRQSASNRATIGASELQHFRASESHDADIRIEGLSHRLLFVSDSVLERFAPLNLQVRAPKSLFFGSVWFRPPPAA
jgi:hypothetical protein